MTHTTTINRPEGLLVKLNTWHSRRRLLADMCTGYKSLRLLSGYGGGAPLLLTLLLPQETPSLSGTIPAGEEISRQPKASFLYSTYHCGIATQTQTHVACRSPLLCPL